jgi:hypothetical protein
MICIRCEKEIPANPKKICVPCYWKKDQLVSPKYEQELIDWFTKEVSYLPEDSQVKWQDVLKKTKQPNNKEMLLALKYLKENYKPC